MKSRLDVPMAPRRGKLIFIGSVILVVAIFVAIMATGVSWGIRENIAKATAPWSEYSMVKMELRPLTSNQIEIKIESGYQQDQTKLKTIEITEEEGIVEAVARSKHFTLPKGETVIYLPVSSKWTRIRVILSLSSTYADRLTVEGELTRESQ